MSNYTNDSLVKKNLMAFLFLKCSSQWVKIPHKTFPSTFLFHCLEEGAEGKLLDAAVFCTQLGFFIGLWFLVILFAGILSPLSVLNVTTIKIMGADFIIISKELKNKLQFCSLYKYILLTVEVCSFRSRSTASQSFTICRRV